MLQDEELLQVHTLASTLTAAASPADSLEAARTATAQLLESVRGASSRSDAVLEGRSTHTAAACIPKGDVESLGEGLPTQVLSYRFSSFPSAREINSDNHKLSICLKSSACSWFWWLHTAV